MYSSNNPQHWMAVIDYPGSNSSQGRLGFSACSQTKVGTAKLERHLKKRHKSIRKFVI